MEIKRWFYLLLSSIVMLFAGIIYAWSILKVPLEAEFSWSAASLSLNFTIMICFFSAGNIVGGLVSQHFGVRAAATLAALFSCAGFSLASRVQEATIVLLYLGYGALAGLGIGITFNLIISVIGTWFPDKRGLCSGCIMMCYGGSALVIGRLAEALFAVPGFGWRGTYLLLGLCLGALLLAAALVLHPCPDKALPPADNAHRQEERAVPDVPTRRMLVSRLFWLSFLWLALASAIGNAVISFARELTISVGASASAASLLVGIMSISNAFGRVLMGSVYDFLGCRRTMLAATLLSMLAAASSLISVANSLLPLCVFGICVTGVSYGACSIVVANLAAAFFGRKYFQTNFSILSLTLSVSSLVTTVINILFVSKGNFVGAFCGLLGVAAVSLVLYAFIPRNIPKATQT